MPVEAENSTANGLFEMFAHPPIPFFVKTAYTDCASTGSTGKFVLLRRPADKRGSPIQSKQHKSRLPCAVTLGLPNVCISLELEKANRLDVDTS